MKKKIYPLFIISLVIFSIILMVLTKILYDENVRLVMKIDESQDKSSNLNSSINEKEERLGEYKNKVKLLEETNLKYTSKISELEDESQKLNEKLEGTNTDIKVCRMIMMNWHVI